MPTVIRDLQSRMAKGGERAEILERMEELCAALGTRAFRETDVGLEIRAPESAPGAAPGP